MTMTGWALPGKEPVLTPGGFIRMDRVRVGTTVITPDGETAQVTAVEKHADVPVYTVVFSDGSKTSCSGESRWLSRIINERDSTAERTTADIIALMEEGKTAAVPLCSPLPLNGGNEPGIKPYTMGAILGDGCTRAGTIRVIKRDMELFDRIREDGYTLKRYYPESDRTPVFALKEFSTEKAWLKEKDLLCRGYRKYVPPEYLFAPLEERMEIIRGLMDTDGFASRNGVVEYSTTSRRLARNVQWLIRSIGGTAGIRSYIPYCTFPDGTRKRCRRAYAVKISTPDNASLFTIPRKKDRCLNRRVIRDGFHPRRRIMSVTPQGRCECISITVGGADNRFVTRDFTVARGSQAE